MQVDTGSRYGVIVEKSVWDRMVSTRFLKTILITGVDFTTSD